MKRNLMPRHAATLAIGLLLAAGIAQAQRVDRYVWTNSPSPGTPFSTWDTAAHQIQQAVDVAVAANGDEVIVRAGVFDQGGKVSEGLTNRVYVSSGLTLRSEHNDPENTIIMGRWDPISTNGPAAVRCVLLAHHNARLYGFTLTNGATLAVGSSIFNIVGGGIVASPAAVISNCVIVGNVAQTWGGAGGGGAYQGTYYNCKFLNNGFANNPASPYGGGVFNGTLYNCLLAGNTAERGGGAYRGVLVNCIVSNNVAIGMTGTTPIGSGGGVRGASATDLVKVYDSLIIHNWSDRGGGAGIWSWVDNSEIVGNQAPVTPTQADGYGGGVYGDHQFSWIYNCRVVSNSAHFGGGLAGGVYATNSVIAFNEAKRSWGGGGLDRPRLSIGNCLFYGNTPDAVRSDAPFAVMPYLESCTIVGNEGYGVRNTSATANLTVRNSILWNNGSGNWRLDAGTLTFLHSLTSPAQDGWDASNMVADPQFVVSGTGHGLSHVPGNYRLKGTSPAIGAGDNQDWMAGAVDLDGNPRIDRITGQVDMGAFEFVYQATILMVR